MPETDVHALRSIWLSLDELADAGVDGTQDVLASLPAPARDGSSTVDERLDEAQRTKDEYDDRPLIDWDEQVGRDVRDLQPGDVEAVPLPRLPDPSDPRTPEAPPEVERTKEDALALVDAKVGGARDATPQPASEIEPRASLMAPIFRMLDEGARLAGDAVEQTAAKVTGLMLVLMSLLGLFGAAGAAGASPLATMAVVARQAATPEGASLLGAFAVASLSLLPRFRRWWIPVLAPLLSRITPDRIMEHEARKQIFDFVRAEPGISLNGIVAKLGLSRNAVAYHLAVFESEHTIVSVKDGKYRRYFLNGGKYVNGAKDVVATLRNEKTLRVAQFVLSNPGSIQKELCAAVGTSPSATNWHITRLEKVHLIRKSRVANTVRYFGGEALAKYDLAEFGLARATVPGEAGPIVAAPPVATAPSVPMHA